MPAGNGRIATVFISALEGGEIKDMLKVDTTTTPPGNSLQMVKPPVEEVIPALVKLPAEKKK